MYPHVTHMYPRTENMHYSSRKRCIHVSIHVRTESILRLSH